MAGNLPILVPRAYDPSNLRQGSRVLAGPDFLSMRRVFVSYSQPIRFSRFDGKSVNRRSEGSWAVGMRMEICSVRPPRYAAIDWTRFLRHSGYFRIRNFFFPDSATVHTYPANSTANPGKNNSALQSGKKYIRNESHNVWTGESGYFFIR